jgi:hypothetical protein
LVFDNADEPDMLHGYLPTRHGGHVRITSRRSHFRAGVQAVEVRHTVFVTLDLAMRKVREPVAEDLLGLIACLAPDAIMKAEESPGRGVATDPDRKGPPQSG